LGELTLEMNRKNSFRDREIGERPTQKGQVARGCKAWKWAK